MIYKFRNAWTTRETYYEFPKGTRESVVLKHFEEWLTKDGGFLLSDEAMKKALPGLVDVSEMIRLKPIKKGITS